MSPVSTIRLAFLLCTSAISVLAGSPPSNLPEPMNGTFSVLASSIIDTDVETAWNSILNFSAYPDWNPFVRSQEVLNEWSAPADDQTPVVGSVIRITSQIPPLPIPVNASTPPNVFNIRITTENVSHILPETHQVRWYLLSIDEIIAAERWSTVSEFVDDDNKTKVFYESRGVYSGALSSTVQALLEKNITSSFQAQADAMKLTLEA